MRALLMTLLILIYPAIGTGEEIALFTVDARLSGDGLESIDVALYCDRDPPFELTLSVPAHSSRTFTVAAPDEGMSCTLKTGDLPGRRLEFLGDGGSTFDPDGEGCTFTGVMRGHSNFCQIRVESEETTLTVFKHWIGTSDREEDARITLECGDGNQHRPLMINSDRTGTWKLEVTSTEGVVCNVIEEKSDAYIDDVRDCQGLVIRPGAEEECTVVNTRVVKMIEMFNRYGLFVMILAFMIVGGFAARKVIP